MIQRLFHRLYLYLLLVRLRMCAKNIKKWDAQKCDWGPAARYLIGTFVSEEKHKARGIEAKIKAGILNMQTPRFLLNRPTF